MTKPVATTEEGEDALSRIYSIDMFTKEGWKIVHEGCDETRERQKEVSNEDLATCFLDYLLTWYEDNEVTLDDFEDEEDVDAILIMRFTDYLLYD